MTDQLKDQVSALLDDELEARECTLVMARLSRDEDLRSKWERYSLIGDCIRGNLPEYFAVGLAGRVAAEVERNPVAQAQPRARLKAIWRPLAGVAVAASVAMVALISLSNTDGDLPIANAPVAVSADQESYTVPVVNMREQASASLRERLNLYKVSHSEFAGPMQRRSLLSQMASDDSFEEPEQPTDTPVERE